MKQAAIWLNAEAEAVILNDVFLMRPSSSVTLADYKCFGSSTAILALLKEAEPPLLCALTLCRCLVLAPLWERVDLSMKSMNCSHPCFL